MVKIMIKKLIPIMLPVIIWLIMVLYHGVVLKPFSDFMLSVSAPFFLSFILHTLIQLLILCVITIAAVKKLGYEIRGMIVSIPIMYLLFTVYSPSSIYLFVYTGGLSIAFGQPQPAMPSWAAAIIIVLQYGVVMLITALAAARKKET